MEIIKAISIFILAGICEIGGGYMIWQWLKQDKPLYWGVLGGMAIFFYGVVATWQTADFSKVYATYGGFFIVLSIIWAMKFDNYVPDKFDIIGAVVALVGVCIIYFGKLMFK